MEIIAEHFEDAGKRDAEGYYDYYYSWFVYIFREGRSQYAVRRYDDHREEAAFMEYAEKPSRKWIRRTLDRIPYEDELFQKAASALLGDGVRDLTFFFSDYQPIPIRRIHRREDSTELSESVRASESL